MKRQKWEIETMELFPVFFEADEFKQVLADAAEIIYSLLRESCKAPSQLDQSVSSAAATAPSPTNERTGTDG